jgi:putative transposase
MDLVAVMDWYSRYVLSWRISNTLDRSFCLAALNAALKVAKADSFNTDQGRTIHLQRLYWAIRKGGNSY